MIEFLLSIDLGKKENFNPKTDHSMPVDRAFVAQALTDLLTDLAVKIQSEKTPAGTIQDESGRDVGSWRFAMKKFED